MNSTSPKVLKAHGELVVNKGKTFPSLNQSLFIQNTQVNLNLLTYSQELVDFG